jgi:tetratricopeptide (TPR) repeat protein
MQDFQRPFAPRQRLSLAVVLAACLMGPMIATAQEPPKSWTERETRLANEYLSLLVSQPDYGRVVDLLWNLYEKHAATPLLLENISAQAAATRHPTVLLVQGHLYRRAGDLAKAAELYDEVLQAEPKNTLALRSRAEVARQQADPALAYTLIKRWLEDLEDTDPVKPQAWIELGTLAHATDQGDAAVEAWEAAARLRPGDMEMSRQVAELLLRAGFPARAAAFYSALTEQGDPQKRLDALYDLARIQEHADEFAKAENALLKGLALLDFRDGRYRDFFLRRVRLNERFGNLDELRDKLKAAASDQPFSEQAWRDWGRFNEITVDVDAHLEALRRLVQEVPQADDYRWELVRVLLDHDGAEEAAKLLDARMQKDGGDLPAIVFLRCEADLRQGQTQQATERLKQLLTVQTSNLEVEKQVLNFAQTRALDAVIERILTRRVEREPGKTEAVFELAGFYRARNDALRAEELLRQFTAQAVNVAEQQQRLNDSAAFLASGSDLERAILLAREAAGNATAGREEWLRLADLLAEHGDTDEATGLLEKAWQASTTDEDRQDVDERLFSVLMGEQKAPVRTSIGTAGDFKLPDAFTGKGFATAQATPGEASPLPEAVLNKAMSFFILTPPKGQGDAPSEKVKRAREKALVLPMKPELADNEQAILRAAWWALRTDRLPQAYALLLRLHLDPGTGQVKEPPMEAEKLLLDLAMTDKNPALAMRVLRRLMLRDSGNRIRYTLRLSELLMESEQAAVSSVQNSRWIREAPSPLPVVEATRLLEQTYREMPESGQLLSALTQAYTLQRRLEEALQLWKEAVRRVTGSAAVPLLERYADLLLRMNKLEEYVQVQMDIVEREADVKRRREAFRRFADRLLWSADGGDLPTEVSEQRLKLIEKALTEQTLRHPFDGFYHEALALVFERGGDTARAFQSMKQAYYTSPETPFSLGQLREAALKVADVKSAIYFQKQIAATAPPAELAAESRRLVELLEQTFQIAEADRVRKRLESRFSQDVTALENLAEHYRTTGQDEAERRVYEQVARVRPWDAQSQLRIALKSLRLADEAAAEKALREILARTEGHVPVVHDQAATRLPLPITDLRKVGAPGPVTEITGLLDSVPGLDNAATSRLRAFFNLQRPEFTELPEAVELVRLRVIEELARLVAAHRGEDSYKQWVADWSDGQKSAMERLWALYYAGAGSEFRQLLRQTLKETPTLELRFAFLWLTLRSHGLEDALAWAREAGVGNEILTERKQLFHAVVAMLADLDSFRFAKGELTQLGESRLLPNATILGITRDLQDQQRYAEALELGESLRRNSPAMADDYAFFLSRIAESAERWDLARQYLGKVVKGPVRPGAYRGTYDPYLYSLSTVNRLATSEQEREETLREAWKRLQSTPDSALTRLRKSAVAGMAGAVDTAAEELGSFIAGDFLGARRMGEPPGLLMPQGSTRHEEALHLRGLWEETREIQASFVQQGLSRVVHQANEGLTAKWGAVGLSSQSGEFSEWRLGHLSRQLRQVDYPTRLRMIREYLATVDMKMEVNVETLSELGGRLESQGMAREAIDVYRLLPERAPANPEYAQWLIRASETAHETQMGLKFTLQLLLAKPPMKPPLPGDEVLYEKHAHFLAQDFNIQELEQRGAKLPPTWRALQGRIPPVVNYLRELALLYERMDRKKEALETWDRLYKAYTDHAETGILPDAETCLHRGRLLQQAGRREDALQSLRAVPLTEAAGAMGREVLKLRADILAESGGWEEFRELMAVAVERKSPDAMAHLADLLRQHGHTTDALNLLTQGERSVQTDPERFSLRLELLKILAQEPSWTPDQGRAQLAALIRVKSRDREVLKQFVTWMGEQAMGRNQDAWAAFFRAEARAGLDRPLAALALCALAKGLPETAVDDIAQGWSAAKEGDRLCLELGAEALLKAGRISWAWDACQILQDLPTKRLDGRKLPLMVRVAHAMGERARVLEYFAEVIRRSVPGGVQPMEWAQAFEDVGESGLARELYAKALEKLESTQSMQPDLCAGWVRFLIRHQDYEVAEVYLMKQNWALVKESASLIFELYQAWGKLASVEAELPKFHLPAGVLKETLFLSRRAQDQPPPAAQP